MTHDIHPERRPVDSLLLDRVGLIIMALANTGFGVGLWFQSQRWSNTPAYALLLDVFPTQAWGTIYLAVALVMALTIRWHRNWPLGVMAHTLGIALATTWWFAFIVRYLTDDGTTIANPISWGVQLLVLGGSSLCLYQRKVQGRLA